MKNLYVEKRKVLITFLACVCALLVLGRIFLILKECGALYAMGIIYLLSGIGLVCVWKNGLFLQGTINKVSQIGLAIIFTVSQVAGLCFSVLGISESVSIFEMVVWCMGLLPLTIAGQNYFFLFSDRYYEKNHNKKCDVLSRKKCLGFAFGIIFVGFLIPFFAYYPAIMAYDVLPQLTQIRLEGYSTHHPLIHTLMLAGALKIGELLPVSNHDTVGLAIHVIVQMIIMAFAFAYVYVYFRMKNVRKVICNLFLVYVAFWPTHGLLAVAITKDSIFAVLVMLFTLFTYQLIIDKQQVGTISVKWQIAYISLNVLMLLFRNNSIYAWCLFIVVFTLFSLKKWYVKKVLFSLALSFLVYLTLNWGMICWTDATSNTYAREMLSVPTQQIARVIAYHEEQLTEDEKESIFVVWEDNMPEYVPAIADRSKKDVSNEKEELDALKKVWLELGKKYPGEYIKAFLIKNMGLWYLDDISYLDIYTYAKGYLQISYPGNQQEIADVVIPGYERHQRLQFLQSFYRHFAYGDVVWKYIPFIALFMQPAFYCWGLFYYCINCIRTKRWLLLIPTVFLVALIGTILLGPCVLIRYMYPVMISVLVLILLPAESKIS